MVINWLYRNNELLIWTGAMVWLYTMINPAENAQGWCPFRAAGIDLVPGEGNCMGCGIGRSINAVMHGRFTQSLTYHWAGIPALLAIAARIIKLVTVNYKTQNIIHG
ncbi:DUF2752 domain-containing protein [Flavihumibacter stibioxidans]|uniref:DUF2752 domain-containing protein n=1 Tax=Flavihumibacter stibioxidans TaxID=1834163 RepID=A0ABR7MA35_9BACT|nr:DUF2752 domain-containing protein [Flavihumibacter stibioxidans]MBC6491913.1 hypothetical protein [Flavihumibacter stibioxidans]